MTLIYTPYTSLEDAWGSNFDNDTQVDTFKGSKKKMKVKKTKNDPLCELYSKRYKKMRKPYYSKDSDMIENDYFSKVHSFKGDKDLNMYYGYTDDTFSRSVNSERQQRTDLTIGDEEGQCVDTNRSLKKKKKRLNLVFHQKMKMTIIYRRQFLLTIQIHLYLPNLLMI